MKKKMSEEVAKSEMQRLRDLGYSNTQIAEQLECCYATVLKYIGKGGCRRKNNLKPAEHNSVVSDDRLSMISRAFQGACSIFVITKDGIRIDFNSQNCSVFFGMSEYEEFVKDSIAVSQVMR